MSSFFSKLFGVSEPKAPSVSEEVTHINQEVYKKSVELSERNKTLLLLRKIDEIILSSVTDKYEIARRVTSLLVMETDFQIAAIFQYEEKKQMLKRLAIYEKSSVFESNVKNSAEQFYVSEISTAEIDNAIILSVRDKMPKSSNTLQNSLLTKDGFSKAQIMQESTGIKSVYAYPLIVRNQLIGSMVIALVDEEQNIAEYTKDLLERLVQVIGIALDNASLYTELQEANEKLKTLDKLKDEFVSLASHELRTPMTAIKSYLWMTLQGDSGLLNDTQKLYIERAYNSTERLIKLVNDMLNISRIEAGRVTVELQKTDIYKLTQEVVEDVQPRASEVGVHVAISPTPDLPAVLADGDKIKEVLFNLIGNSLKFTPKGGNVIISFNKNEDVIETIVTDTGVGISAENISKLFQKFSMLPESYAANKNVSGTGLGLYISRSIIELHHGKIWASSEGIGKGSQVSFTLKVFTEDDAKLLAAKQETSQKEKLGIVHSQI